MTCSVVDELAAAYALGSLEPDEERAVSDHLASCQAPHAEAREAIAGAAVVPAGLEPVVPTAALRSRVMATIASTPQERAVRPTAPEPRASAAADRPVSVRETAAPSGVDRRPWWRVAPLPAALAAAGLAAAVGLGAWNVSLNARLAEREATLRAVAAADAAFAVTGAAGSGWIVETGGQAVFLADALAELPADRIYELWLIGADGSAVAAGVVRETDAPVVAELEVPLGSATTFAVTVEERPVDQPTSDPVLVAPLGT